MTLDRAPELVDPLAAERLGADDRRDLARPEREHLPDVGLERGVRGWSSLLIAITSGISITPAFSAWIESPEPGISASTIVSAIVRTPISF